LRSRLLLKTNYWIKIDISCDCPGIYGCHAEKFLYNPDTEQEVLKYKLIKKGKCMSKSQDTKKETKKKPQMTLKEKRAAKQAKKAAR
jgi:hypothetical protein